MNRILPGRALFYLLLLPNLQSKALDSANFLTICNTITHQNL